MIKPSAWRLNASKPRSQLFGLDSIDWNGAQRMLSASAFVALGVLLILASVIFPIIPIIGIILFVFLLFRSKIIAAIGVILVVVIIFGWMNGEKRIEGDWAWYTYHHMILSDLPFSEYIGGKFGVIVVKSSEPVYHFISFLTAVLTGGNVKILAWVVSSVIYVQLGVALFLLLGEQSKTNFQIAAVIFFALLVGVTFTLTTQLVRQEISASFIVLGWAFWARKYYAASIIWILLGLFTHNSSIAPIFTVIFAAAIGVSKDKTNIIRTILSFPVFIAAGYLFVRYSGDGGYYTIGKSDGYVSVYVYIFDFLIFIVFSITRHLLPELLRLTSIILVTWVLYVAFLVGAYFEPLPFLRMYFYIEMLRMAMLALIMLCLFRSKKISWMVVPLLITSIAYVEARLIASPFWFQGGLLGHLLRPFAIFF